MFQWQPYAQGYFYMKSLLELNLIYKNEFIVDLPKAKAYPFFSSIFNSDFKWCWGIGWEAENFKLSLQMKQQWMNCYKNIIYDLGTMEGVW